MPWLRKMVFAAVGIAAFCISSALSVSATPLTFYPDRTLYESAASTTLTIGFEGLASANSFTSYGTSSGLTVSGVNFTGPYSAGHYLNVVDSGYDPHYAYGTGAVLVSQDAGRGGHLVVTLPEGTTAIGTNIMLLYNPDEGIDYQSRSINVTINYADGTSSGYLTTVGTRPMPGFLGITSDRAILSLVFSADSSPRGIGNYLMLDNFSYGTANAPAPVPEPATLLLLGTGLAGVAMKWRGRKREH